MYFLCIFEKTYQLFIFDQLSQMNETNHKIVQFIQKT